ncbi:MAG TPA: hypothetical protein VGH23_12270 [Rhizomicrobium sp.]|jgi:hypothetical protein
MSYDLAVFEPATPPPNHAGFLAWFKEQTKWREGHGYNDPNVTTPALHSWLLEMIKTFPALNGPYASEANIDNLKTTDYSIGKTMIYATFAWSELDDARRTMFALAKKHRVGFFDVSADDGEVWLPRKDDYVHVFGTGNSSQKLGKARAYIFEGTKTGP